MRYQIRPLGLWTDPLTLDRRSSGVFRSTWSDTLGDLAREVELLDGEDPVIIQIDVTDAQVRADGMLKERAKVGDHPGVVVSFQSRFGALRYTSDAYEQRWNGAMPGWQANVRAVALGLEALRAVDRYGISKRGEQYAGWTAIGSAAPGRGPFTTRAEAEKWMRMCSAEVGIGSGASLDDLYRRLAKRMHPDVAGGSTELWERLDAAATLLGVRGNQT